MRRVALSGQYEASLRRHDRRRMIFMDTCGNSFTNFGLSDEMVAKLKASGAQGVRNFFDPDLHVAGSSEESSDSSDE